MNENEIVKMAQLQTILDACKLLAGIKAQLSKDNQKKAAEMILRLTNMSKSL